MRRPIRIGLVSVVGALALTSGVAQAASLTKSTTVMVYTAAAGEANSLTVARSGDNYVFTDAPAVTITPGGGCVVGFAANVATCPAVGVVTMTIDLNNLNDSAAVGASVTGLTAVSTTAFGARIFGGAGDDALTGGPAITNLLDGGAQSGDEPGADTLTGGNLNDSLTSGGGVDSIAAGEGDDTIAGGPGNDTLSGQGGNDSFAAGSFPDGADLLDGGDGVDSLSYRDRTADVSIDSGDGADDGAACPGAGCEGDNVTGIESLEGGRGNDILTGTPSFDTLAGNLGLDVIDGGAGGDTVTGGEGKDQLAGGTGDDVVNGNDGDDVVNGGEGNDSFSDGQVNSASSDADTYAGGGGLDSISYGGESLAVTVSLDGAGGDGAGCPGAGCEGDNVGVDVEDASGTVNNDVLIGNEAPNEFFAGIGDDVLVGAGGADLLSGQAGNDTIDGGADSDAMDGGTGIDTLRSRDLSPDQVDCGSALDSVLGDPLDLPEASCEQTSLGLVIGEAKLSKSGKKVKLAVTCPALEGIACAVSAALTAKGKTVASGKGTVASGATMSLPLKAKDPIKGKLKTDASATFADAQGVALTTTRKVTVG